MTMVSCRIIIKRIRNLGIAYIILYFFWIFLFNKFIFELWTVEFSIAFCSRLFLSLIWYGYVYGIGFMLREWVFYILMLPIVGYICGGTRVLYVFSVISFFLFFGVTLVELTEGSKRPFYDKNNHKYQGGCNRLDVEELQDLKLHII